MEDPFSPPDSSVSQPPPLPVDGETAFVPRFSRPGFFLAWVVIFFTVGWIVWRTERGEKESKHEPVQSNFVLELVGRYTVGAHHFLSQTGNWSAEVEQQYLSQLPAHLKTPKDELGLELLRAWLGSRWPDAAQLEALANQNAEVKADVEALKLLQNKTSLTDEAWKRLKQRHGWLAHLARALPHENEHETRIQVQREGLRTLLAMGIGSFFIFGAVIGGLVLLILTWLKWRAARREGRSGPIVFSRFYPTAPAGNLLMEAFALYLGGFVWLPSLLEYFFPDDTPGRNYRLAAGVVILAVFWPRLRGMPHALWRQSLGLHKGRGVLREMGAGVLVWLTLLPIAAVILFLTAKITEITGDTPVHPIVHEFSSEDGSPLAALLLAVLWAPITEEITFRGLLFPGLATRWRVIASMLLSAFIFAAIHPQGLAAVPALMTLACGFSITRAWRGSLIGGITAHALNNGLITLMMLAAF